MSSGNEKKSMMFSSVKELESKKTFEGDINSIVKRIKQRLDLLENALEDPNQRLNVGGAENLNVFYNQLKNDMKQNLPKLIGTETTEAIDMNAQFIKISAKILEKLKELNNNAKDGIDSGVEKYDLTKAPKPLTNTELKQAIEKKIHSKIVSNACGLRGFDSYAGGEAYEKIFDEKIINKYKFKRFAEDSSVAETFLLYGPPGTGKSLLAEAVAQKLSQYDPRTVFYNISAPDITGPFQGEAEQSLQFLFDDARYRASQYLSEKNPDHVPVVIFMDEIDGLITKGSGGQSSDSLLATFNTETAGVGKNKANKGLIIIAATNYPGKIPANAYSRFTNAIPVGLPLLNDYREIIMAQLKKFGFARTGIKFFDKNRKKIYFTTPELNEDGFIANPEKEDFMYAVKLSDFKSLKAILSGIGFSDDIKSGDNDDSLPDEVITLILKKSQQVIFNLGEEAKIDEVDLLAAVFWFIHYAPRQVDNVFNNVITSMHTNAIEFLNSVNSFNDKGEFRQLWIFEKRQITEKKIEQGKCVTEVKYLNNITPFANMNQKNKRYETPISPFRYSTIDNNFQQNIILESLNGIVVSKEIQNIKYDVQKTDWIIEVERKPIIQNKQGKKLSNVKESTTSTQILDGTKALELLKEKSLKKEGGEETKKESKNDFIEAESEKKKKQEPNNQYQWFVRRILASNGLRITNDNLNNLLKADTFVITDNSEKKLFVKENIIPGIKIDVPVDQETISKMITGYPFQMDDFLPAIDKVKFVKIEDIDTMIYYARTGGFSVKENQEDIQILEDIKFAEESQ